MTHPINTLNQIPAYGTSYRFLAMKTPLNGNARSRARAKKRRDEAVHAVMAAEA